ncbi:MAG: hydroxylamine reductase [Candidatus Delongbacteria bacterium]|nr:hydroxylamine reductase [Candidatus Delongbacteria bacterium]
MFCFQCQETIGNKGCSYAKGFCGKPAEVANLQDLLIHTLKGISIIAEKKGKVDDKTGNLIAKMLFVTITNVNFSTEDMVKKIEEVAAYRDELKKGLDTSGMHDSVNWDVDSLEELHAKASTVGVLATGEDDVRSLRNLLIIGLKGIAAYYEHANVLGYYDHTVNDFLVEALASTTKDLSVEEMIDMVMKAGKMAVDTMALLDKANTTTYGNPEITQVNIGVRNNPGILISGHDLKDMEELLIQTEGTGVDVYTHGEMLPANYYPAFKKFKHFVGNYGNSWWLQDKEFESFNGPILMTTNCLIPPKDSYKNRVFTTSVVAYPDMKHIPDRQEGKHKDFSEIIALAKSCKSPIEIETGTITGGFAHAQVIKLADKVVEAVKSGAIKRFIVMAGCDGRHKERDYFTHVAEGLPNDTVILTAGCAKYRYNKLDLGDIGGIPRVLDAGQCNDSYSLAVIALKLKEVFGLEDINELPISFDIAWYEQKAVAVLLALLFLGIKGIRLGPTLPAFLTPNVIKVLVDNFDIKPIGEVKTDIEAMMAGS